MWVAGALDILHICDVMATSGYLPNMERGRPARHLQCVLPLCPRSRRPPRRTLHLGLSHGRSRSRPDPLDLRDPQRQTLWGHPAPKSWFEEGTIFAGVPTRAPALAAQPIVAR